MHESGCNIKAGVIKIAFIGELEGQFLELSKAAINASKNRYSNFGSHRSGLKCRTSCRFFEDNDINPKKVMINHMDKRSDVGLHFSLQREVFTLNMIHFFVRNIILKKTYGL